MFPSDRVKYLVSKPLWNCVEGTVPVGILLTSKTLYVVWSTQQRCQLLCLTSVPLTQGTKGPGQGPGRSTSVPTLGKHISWCWGVPVPLLTHTNPTSLPPLIPVPAWPPVSIAAVRIFCFASGPTALPQHPARTTKIPYGSNRTQAFCARHVKHHAVYICPRAPNVHPESHSHPAPISLSRFLSIPCHTSTAFCNHFLRTLYSRHTHPHPPTRTSDRLHLSPLSRPTDSCLNLGKKSI